MSEQSTTIRTLETRIEQLEDECDKLRSKLDETQRHVDSAEMGWREPRSDLVDSAGLPLPRLEMVYYRGEYDRVTTLYRMVYRHFLGHLESVNLGETRISGGRARECNDLPIRDGAHIAHDSVYLGIPAFKVVDGKHSPLSDVIRDKHKHAAEEARKHRSQDSKSAESEE